MGFSDLFSQLKFGSKKKFPGKKVLVLEGGGMRGIFLTGVLQAFSDRNYFPWKCIIGSSAGALTGTAYAAGQIHLARDAFFTKLLTGDFIHFSNILRQGRHILDLDWMVETIIKGEEPIDEKKLKKNAPVIITATHCGKYAVPETVYLNSKKDNISTALKATSAIPFLYKGFVHYKKYHLLDGALLDPIPYKKALELGFKEDEIVVIVTRGRGYRKKEESFWIKTILESYYNKREFHHLVELLTNRYKLYNSIREDLENVRTKIDVIYPPRNFRVDRLTQDEKKILEGFEQGIQEGVLFLKGQ
ncbi:MAG TPA: patatin family protein [Spirochaetota bacterium]|nr:patatin family protein [Spirochaetota bacterium]HPI90837.1 patatin family protein [Spirochaetota bacterium]HPR47632.1 patatin family protein [Spirochaetota bacterium]